MTFENLDLLKTQAFIGGDWIDATSGASFVVSNPATGGAIATVTNCDIEDTKKAIKAADAAFKSWASWTAAQRAQILMRWRALLLENAQALAEILTAEMGKPIAEAIGEINYGASYLEWYAEEAKRAYGDVIPSTSPSSRAIVIKQPVGVCAAITPWNFPNAMLMRKAAAALAAGCTMVAKPAEDTPLSALALAVLAEKAGLPAGVLNIVPTTKAADVGLELTTNPLVRKVSFTGSTGVGKVLLQQAASTVKKVSMELGGNAPFIVFDDADIDAAVTGALASKYRNAGQTCVCANRFFVHRSVHDEFISKLSDKVAEFTVGRGDIEGNNVGPLINEAALKKVELLLASALRDGASVLVGGKKHIAGALFFEPTIVTGVRAEMEIASSEIFGPIAPVIVFDDEDDVIADANNTPYGLAAYVYTQNLSRAWRVGEALDFGMVGINEGIISSVSAPFGGVKQSGMGREGSKYGLEDYLEVKYLCMGGVR
ncbi:NAD-dependent succinate-semialdehyde dehydrogenase [Hyphococcus lacteus]|uniref:NAD-dependent succinate-semialdehyde dehydrogenase n=1 Tax=Hyphococcus lacteus TaxID=3143536 RepID=A0ABV3Z5Q8_9PROT